MSHRDDETHQPLRDPTKTSCPRDWSSSDHNAYNASHRSRESSKSLRVHNILNPPESPHPWPSARPSVELPQSNPGASHSKTLPPAENNTYTFRPLHQGGPADYGSHPGTPVSEMARSGPQSPPLVPPLPALNYPREFLSPRLSRATSLARNSPPAREIYDARHESVSLPAKVAGKRRHEENAPEDAHRFPSSPYYSYKLRGLPPSTRSLSQPLGGQDAKLAQPEQPQGFPKRAEPNVHVAHPGSPFRSFSMAGPPTIDRPSAAWNQPIQSQMGNGPSTGLLGPEEAYMTLPGSDIPIPVQVDYSQASKKADEKRQRNAKASTRHRRKKKTLQEENVRQLQELREEAEELSRAVKALKRQRDFYREQRNRLRDIVARTSSISDHAAGPPSPASPRSVPSIGERSPLFHTSLLATPSQGYASEASSTLEGPMPRQRTEERPEFSNPFYGGATSGSTGSLPSYANSLAGPPRPGSASSVGSVDRLPPLRAVEGVTLSGAHGVGPVTVEQNPVTGHWTPVQARPMETGFATTTQRHPRER